MTVYKVKRPSGDDCGGVLWKTQEEELLLQSIEEPSMRRTFRRHQLETPWTDWKGKLMFWWGRFYTHPATWLLCYALGLFLTFGHLVAEDNAAYAALNCADPSVKLANYEICMNNHFGAPFAAVAWPVYWLGRGSIALFS